jgi:hypothetical protein
MGACGACRVHAGCRGWGDGRVPGACRVRVGWGGVGCVGWGAWGGVGCVGWGGVGWGGGRTSLKAPTGLSSYRAR